VFLFHWKEESQHAILDELEWRREDARLDASARDAAVDDLIALVGAVDGILQLQSGEDARYFALTAGRAVGAVEAARLQAASCMPTAGSTSCPACRCRNSPACSRAWSARRSTAGSPRRWRRSTMSFTTV
jgi:hypothetical protein